MGQPVVHGGANLAALDRRIAGAVVSGDQQQDAITAGDRLLQATIDRRPGSIEIEAVKVQDPVRLDRAAAKPLVPAAVERLVGDRSRLRLRLR